MLTVDTSKFLYTNADLGIQNRKTMQRNLTDMEREVMTDGREGRWDVPNLGLFIDSELQASAISTNKQNFAYVLSFQKEVTESVRRVGSINDRLNQLLRVTRNSNPFNMPFFKPVVQDLLQELTGVLNRRFLGETLLGGTDTKTDVVQDLTTLSALPSHADPAENLDYYLGNTETCNLKLDGERHIQLFSVNAIHPLVQKTITALRMCLTANEDNPQDPCLESALTLSTEAQKDYGSALEETAYTSSVVKSAIDENSTQEVIVSEFFQSTGIRDKYEALARVSEYEANLKMSMNFSVSEYAELQRFMDQVYKHM